MSAIAAQRHSRSSAIPSSATGSAFSQAAGALPRKKIPSLRARERQGATRAIESRHLRTVTARLRRPRSAIRYEWRAKPAGEERGAAFTKGNLMPSRIDL